MSESKSSIVYDVMDVYPHIVGRKTKCWCGKELLKGTEAFLAVLHPNPGGYWPGHKIICSFNCNIEVSTERPEEKK